MQVRSAPKDTPLYYLYVCVPSDRLLGVISLASLVRTQDDVRVEAIMRTELNTIEPNDSRDRAAQVVTRNNILAVPVVEQGSIIGLVTVDDVIDIVEKEATEDMYNMAGLSQGDRIFSHPLSSLKKRIPWNALNLITTFLAASVVSAFEGTISRYAVLAVFMPVIAGIGGNAGNQTLTIMIRGITLGELEFARTWRAVLKEMTVGLLMGILLGTIAAIVAIVWKGNPLLGIVVALSMMANILLSATIGTMIPLTLKRFGLDPALGGSILVTMCTDVFGFFAFLSLAQLLLM